MIVRNSEIEMLSRVDTMEIKAQIVRKLGHEKAEIYFYQLKRYLSGKLSKSRFDKICIGTIGRGNISIHNQLIRSIIKNVCLATSPPTMRKATSVEGSSNVKKVENGYQRNSRQSLCGDVFPPSPRKGRSSSLRDRKFRERPSPLGPHGKTFSSTICNESDPRALEQQSATELFSLGSRPPVEVTSVEDGEEVEQMKGNSPSIQSRSSVSAPLGISRGARKSPGGDLLSTSRRQTCRNNGELPDTLSLRTILEQKMEKEELDISLDFLNVLNIGLDAYLKRLIKPCIELAGSRLALENIKQMYGQAWHERSRQMSNSSISVSMLDFRTAMESAQVSTSSTSASMLDFRGGMQLNPRLLGVDWPTELEKVVLRQSED
ncbi:hypothetical protein GIB67_014568 [Kingdonia uniflora]|uniref:Transcriptional regulator of RNA polII, SAGA, subunit n=1 Tax=Kingdonia uniflora TaxID=39325 RepID=A0A7J7MV72_9MAGN|nr:hypothetical protein GIB67_014568 [Kingdonia uniflora]